MSGSDPNRVGYTLKDRWTPFLKREYTLSVMVRLKNASDLSGRDSSDSRVISCRSTELNAVTFALQSTDDVRLDAMSK